MFSKILFLDIDGVLVTGESMALTKSPHAFGKGPLSELHRILDATGCKIVISSTWRFQGMDNLVKELWVLGLRVGEIVGATPILETGRGNEILAWLGKNPAEKFVVVDDESHELGPVSSHLVQTDLTTGLTPELAAKIIEALNA